MAFQTPVTAAEILGAIHQKQYLLPAIQREFVWNPDQIHRLFDSLMRGYPMGSFLLWKVDPETAKTYTFYDFLTHYHERDNPYANKATVPAGRGITAVLDGQQRLTALNIAIYGSHAEKKKYAWWTSPDAFPTKRLYLNLEADAEENDLGLRYDLRFLTDADAKPQDGQPDRWYRVGAVLELDNAGPALYGELTKRSLDLAPRRASSGSTTFTRQSVSRSRSTTTWSRPRTPTRSWTSSCESTAAAPRCPTPTCCCRWRRTSGNTSTPVRRSASGAVALSDRAILTPQIFRHKAEDRRQDSHQSPNAAGNRTTLS